MDAPGRVQQVCIPGASQTSPCWAAAPPASYRRRSEREELKPGADVTVIYRKILNELFVRPGWI